MLLCRIEPHLQQLEGEAFTYKSNNTVDEARSIYKKIDYQEYAMMLKQSRNFKRWKAKAFTTKEPFTTTENDSRLDIKANELLVGRFSRTFFDVKSFNAHAKSCPKTISDAYKHHGCQNIKIPTKNLDVEHSSFGPLIFACTGGATPGSSKIVQKLAEKRHKSNSDTINFRKAKISFALLRSAIRCLRGCKKLKNTFNIDNSICATTEEGRF